MAKRKSCSFHFESESMWALHFVLLHFSLPISLNFLSVEQIYLRILVWHTIFQILEKCKVSLHKIRKKSLLSTTFVWHWVLPSFFKRERTCFINCTALFWNHSATASVVILVSIILRIINGNSQKKKYVSRQVIAAKVTSEISFYVIVLCFMGKFYWHVLLPHSKDMFYDLEFSSCTLLCKKKIESSDFLRSNIIWKKIYLMVLTKVGD